MDGFTDQDIMDVFEMTEEDMADLPEDTEDEEDLQELEETDEDEEQEEDAEEDPLRAERERIAEQTRQSQQAALDAQVASLNLLDPYRDNAPITTQAELQAYQQRSRQEKLSRVAKAAGLSDDELKELIEQHPDVVAGRQMRQQMEQQSADAARKQAEQRLAADIADIAVMCPGVDSEEKIVTHESWPEVKRLMEDNPKLGLKQAFRLANADAIAASAGKKAQNAAKRNAASKGHLRSAGGRGEGLGEVPADVRAIYRAMDPTMTDAEMRKHYAANNK